MKWSPLGLKAWDFAEGIKNEAGGVEINNLAK